MICTVTTLKDNLDNVRHFVEGNLSQGVDLMLVFLDGPDEPVEQFLAEHPHVLLFRGPDWWGETRPTALNARQRVNAYFAGALLSRFPWAEWLFHIDGDEIALLDHSVVSTVPAEYRAIHLAPLEAASEPVPTGRATRFKRLLERDELFLLHGLGVIAKPNNGQYFHGHVNGKSGIRPAVDIRLGAHVAVDAAGERIEHFEHADLRHLHYESDSAEEFVRKWSSMASSGRTPRMRQNRRRVVGAVSALNRLDLPQATLQKYLTTLYYNTSADDVDTLSELNLLEHIDATSGDHTPERLSRSDRKHLDRAAARLAREPRHLFRGTADVQATARAVERAAG